MSENNDALKDISAMMAAQVFTLDAALKAVFIGLAETGVITDAKAGEALSVVTKTLQAFAEERRSFNEDDIAATWMDAIADRIGTVDSTDQ